MRKLLNKQKKSVGVLLLALLLVMGVAVARPQKAMAYPSNPSYPGYQMGTWMSGWYDYNVEILQYRLTSVGFSTSGVDGYYGTNTYNAVKSYQYWHGLASDGIVGPDTWNDLFN